MNKQILTILFVTFVLLLSLSFVAAKEKNCTPIKSGKLLTKDGSVITIGYDSRGFNYQAHIFNSKLCDASINPAWCKPFPDFKLIMRWNDAMLSNKDCDGDRLLDKHYGFSSYLGSKAWVTNYQSAKYELNGKTCKWTYFVKIVAAPTDAIVVNGIWYTIDGTEIGPQIWGEFAIVQQVRNDPCAGIQGLAYKSPFGTGFGHI